MSLIFLGPTNGCDAISEEGVCYSYFNSPAIDWYDARRMCIAWGGDLATVTSLEENTLMRNTMTDVGECWIGLNNLNSENAFVWADGSTDTYRLWSTTETNGEGSEDCVGTLANGYWSDNACVSKLSCYFCISKGE